MSFLKNNHLIRFFLLSIILLSPVEHLRSQNPFLGGEEEVPAVRPPAEGTSGALADLQFEFREKTANVMSTLRDNPTPSMFIAFAAAAFLYGLLHGAGPGHRKTIVFSLFLGRSSRWFDPAAAGFLAAGIHAGTAMALIGIFYVARRGLSVSMAADRAGVYMQGITFLVLAVCSLYLLVRTWMKRKHGYQHVGRPGGSLYSMLAVSSLIPCPGATMLLLFALSLDVPLLGVLGVLCMSLGMGVVISAAGYLSYAGREVLFYRLKAGQETIRKISVGLEVVSYLFILLFSLYMAWPFITAFRV